MTFIHIRPISLCNSIYKFISNLIASIIRLVLDKIISHNQAAFVLGRWIGENSILFNEILHTMKNEKGSKRLVSINIDMMKAYDWVD